MKILIAEDNQKLQELNGELMNLWGFDFDIVSNGLEAVEHAQKNEGKYDLCLMDLEMPMMTGLQASKVIRRKFKYFPIIAFSGNPALRKKCFEAGMDDFIEKPCFPDDLLAKLKEWEEVKILNIIVSGKQIQIKKEMPMNPKQSSVLKQLKEKKLSMISIFGTSTEATFVVNEIVPQYIEKKFAENKKQSVKFLDHNPEGKGLCRLFAKTSMVVKTFMLDEDFESENQQEIAKLKEIVINNEC